MGLLEFYILPVLCLAQFVCGYDHEVKAACPRNQTVCEFNWEISKLETLVWYNHTAGGKGYPLVVRNDTYYLRQPDGCMGLEPLEGDELSEIFTGDGIHRYVYTINNMFPGPSIVVYEGQQVVVKVTNRLLQEGTTIHWHGLPQRKTNYMDGTSTVTQCPINPGETFTYRFLAEPAGTHWYHSHYGLQRTDGLAGALIVLPNTTSDQDQTEQEDNLHFSKSGSTNPRFNALDNKQDTETIMNQDQSTTTSPKTTTTTKPPSTFHKDYIMMVQDWFHEDSDDIFVSYYAEIAKFLWDGYNNTDMCHTRTQQLDGGEVGTIPFQSALINGKGQYFGMRKDAITVPHERFHVQAGERYRFRVINAGMNFAINVSIDQHKLYVISSDGMNLEPQATDTLVVHGGERYDFYIEADQPVAAYWIRIGTLEATQGSPSDWEHAYSMVSPGGTLAVLDYEGATVREPTSHRKQCTPEDVCSVVNCPFKEYPDMANATCINFDQLRNAEPQDIPQTKSLEEHFLNFHFPFGHGGILRSQVNGIQFAAPSTPPVVSGKSVFDHPCDLEKCDEEPCICTYQVNVTRDSTVQMVLTSTVTDTDWEGLPATVHPVHLHGHHFHVLKVGYAELDPVTKRYAHMNRDIRCTTPRCNHVEWSDPRWSEGDIPGLNLHNPPLKDTVTVPVGGYVVIRFEADNPGWWIMHCHLELHQVEGMALLIQEGTEEDMTPPPRGFPTCGSFDWSSEEFKQKIGSGVDQLKASTVILSVIMFVKSVLL